MALIVLLVALACLIVGLVLTSSAWLIASLVASAVAGLVLLRDRARRGPVSWTERARRSPAVPSSPPAPLDSQGTGSDAEVWVVDGRPRYHRETCLILKGQQAEAIPRTQADEDGFIPCSMCEPDRAERRPGRLR